MNAIAEVAWAAGFIDGEGCIGIAFAKRGNGGYNLSLRVSQTVRKPLEKLQAMFGGSIYSYQRKSHYKPAWTWNVYGNTARAIVRKLLPYLEVKARQASIALVFPAGLRRCRLKKILQEECYKLMRETNAA